MRRILRGMAAAMHARMSKLLLARSLLIGAFLAAGVASASAQVMVSVVAPEIAIPANGAVVIQALATEAVVEVRAEGSDATLGGTLRLIVQIGDEDYYERYMAWIPSSPLEPGGYEVTLFAADVGRTTQAITVTEAIDLSVVPSPSEPRLEWKAGPHGESTCVIWNGAGLAPDFRSSFPSTQRGYVEMTSDIDSSVSPEAAHQFLYSSTPTGSPSSNIAAYNPGNWAWSTPWSFVEQSDRYCVTYRAMSVATGEEHVVERCAEHGELPLVELVEIEVPDEKLERAVCPGPPAGFEQRWCTINSACDALSDAAAIEADHCNLYGAACRNECLPGGIALGSIVLPGGGGGGTIPTPWGAAGTSGGAPLTAPCVEVEVETDEEDVETDEEDVETDAASPDDDPDADATTAKNSRSCGCSTVGARQSAAGAAAALALVALLVLRVRRRP